MGDLLFDTIASWSGSGRSWGKLLDSGTGAHSLRWIQKLETTSWTAITADEQMKEKCISDSEVKLRSGRDSVLVGNWMDDAFCDNLDKDYDTILADYLIGAVDGFSPYTQDQIIDKLRRHLSPNGRLYLIGMNPIPDNAVGPADIVCEVRRARDACILLANHRPYREYPLEWITRHLEKSGFKVEHTKKFTILHSEDSIIRQVRVASSKLGLMPPPAREGMEMYLNDIARRVKAACTATVNGKIPLSFDYVIECTASPHSIALGSSGGDVGGESEVVFRSSANH